LQAAKRQAVSKERKSLLIITIIVDELSSNLCSIPGPELLITTLITHIIYTKILMTTNLQMPY
jgi:uncharacterized membrane protein AbrB (regulator of aidB expression)